MGREEGGGGSSQQTDALEAGPTPAAATLAAVQGLISSGQHAMHPCWQHQQQVICLCTSSVSL